MLYLSKLSPCEETNQGWRFTQCVDLCSIGLKEMEIVALNVHFLIYISINLLGGGGGGANPACTSELLNG